MTHNTLELCDVMYTSHCSFSSNPSLSWQGHLTGTPTIENDRSLSLMTEMTYLRSLLGDGPFNQRLLPFLLQLPQANYSCLWLLLLTAHNVETQCNFL